MKKWIVLLLLGIALLPLGCSRDRITEPPAPATQDESSAILDANAMAKEFVAQAKWPVEGKQETPDAVSKPNVLPRPLFGFERTAISDDIAHYSIRIPVGAGPYDVIRIHRVVKESRPGVPIRSAKNIFMQHGDAKGFEGVYLPGLSSPTTPDNFGIAVYLARNGVDVWGIDQAWTLVPKSQTDLAFMRTWGLGRGIQHLRLGVAVARSVRALTGCGINKMILSGYSAGVWTTAGLLNEETHLPPVLRQCGAYVPIDVPIKTDSPDMLAYAQGTVDYFQSLYDAGQYQDNVFFGPVGELARCCPDDPSPFGAPLTNRQYALVFCTGPLDFTGFHYWGGVFDGSGMPTGLNFTDTELWLDFLTSAPPYEPILLEKEQWSILSDTGNLPYDDHLSQITVPVLNVIPAGGFGDYTRYGISLLGSTDVVHLRIEAGVSPAEEFGHIDIFTAPAAEQLFWSRLLVWVAAHSN